jgi:hypothetical protein
LKVFTATKGNNNPLKFIGSSITLCGSVVVSRSLIKHFLNLLLSWNYTAMSKLSEKDVVEGVVLIFIYLRSDQLNGRHF